MSAVGCVDGIVHDRGRPVLRKRFGTEYDYRNVDRCGDCGAANGELHHLGCDVERCPSCGWQMIMCGCRFDEDPPDLDDDLDDDGLELTRAVADVIDLFSRQRTGDAPVPFDVGVRSLRLRHKTELADFSSWAAERHATCDIDLAALGLAAMTFHRLSSGAVLLQRPDVVSVMHRAQFKAEDDGVVIEGDLAASVAALIEWMHDRGALDASCDPVDALLEPLRAHYTAPTAAEPHICECFAPYDRTRPPGYRLLRLHSGQLCHARLPDSRADRETARHALDRFGEHLAERWRGEPLDLSLDVLGVVESKRLDRELWVFGDGERPGRYDALVLDRDGDAYLAHRDRRLKLGYRWVPIDPIEAQWRSSLSDRRHRGAVA